MILKIYRGHDPGTIILIAVTGIMVWMKALVNPAGADMVFGDHPMPFYSYLLPLFQGHPLAGTIVSLGLVILTAIYLVNFNTRIFFINERTFLPAALFIILSGYFAPLQSFNPVLPSALLLMTAIDRIIGSYRKQGVAYNFFEASLLVSIASLFYFNMICFFLVVIAGIALLRTISARELVLAITGLVAPYIILVSWYYLAGNDPAELGKTAMLNITGNPDKYSWSTLSIVITIVNGLILAGTMFHLGTVYNTKKVRSRKTFSVLLWVLIVVVLLYLSVPRVSLEIYYLLLIPVSFILAHYMVFKRNKKMANVVFAIIFVSVLLLQLF
ncbi:MAG: DUF6427 family protein [Bacteroidales bacterium]